MPLPASAGSIEELHKRSFLEGFCTTPSFDRPFTPVPSTSTSLSTTSSSPEPGTGRRTSEVTWLFFSQGRWQPFQEDNHRKIEQAFTLGGVYVDIKDKNFPALKCVRVFPGRFYLSYLGMKYRIQAVIQN
ncbi:hypothetical protein BZG36_04756 [Bifiguratus adelaidae]|uniref:WWE domain-containing protein n=1 Tax=Bifiguratus adelaidae TaxID=1938954 RepID=A0A261XVC7_9FUNG|nr:hypothetical protein BZG36_04756 [Bifiguratus adelaidae]